MTTLIETNVIAGPFTLSFTPNGGSAGSLGIIGPEGIRWSRNYSGQPITGDLYGAETILDGVYTGGNLILEFLLQEANRTQVKALAYPFNASTTSSMTATLEHELGVPGVLWSKAAGSLVITPALGTKAAAETTPVRTFGCIAPVIGHTLDQFLGAKLKSFPMRLMALPYDIGSGIIGTHTRAALP